jgi:HPt (histidine-containing phosphotransfer) domain-containing protein
MDDYLAKPIEIRTLDSILTRWIPPSHRSASSTLVAAIENADNDVSKAVTVDLRKIAAMYGQDRARLAPVLEQWSISIGDAVAALVLAVEITNWSAATENVHRIKGSAGIAGAYALSEAGSELEAAISVGDRPRIRELTLRVRALAETALGEVAAWRQAAVMDSAGSGAIT